MDANLEVDIKKYKGSGFSDAVSLPNLMNT